MNELMNIQIGNDMESKWTADLVERLKSQKTRTDQQELIVILHQKSNRSAVNAMELSVLLKAERAKERSKMAEAAAARLLSTHKENERKQRNHRLIQQGLLVDFAGLTDRSRGELLGGLLALAQSGGDLWSNWKPVGDALLARKEKIDANEKS